MTQNSDTYSHGFKYRIYPTREQELAFELAFAANDYVWDTIHNIMSRHYHRCNGKLDKHIRRLRKRIKQLTHIQVVDKAGNPVLDKDGKPKMRKRTDAEMTDKMRAETATLTQRIDALVAQRRYISPSKLQLVRRLRPITLDRNGDPWLSYVTTMADGSLLPDWIAPRKLNVKSPFSGKPDVDGTRFLCVASATMTNTVRNYCTAHSEANKHKRGRPQPRLDWKQKHNIIKQLRIDKPQDYMPTDREIYQKFASMSSHSFSIQVKNNRATSGAAPLSQVIASTGRIARLDIPGVRGTIKCRLHREPEGDVTQATISRDTDGKWFISLTCINIPRPQFVPAPKDETAVEIGIRDYLVLSHGHNFDHPSKQHDLQARIDEESAKLSAKQGGSSIQAYDENGNPKKHKNGKPVLYRPARSKNYERQKKKLAKLKAKQRRIRVHGVHLATAELTRDYQVLAIRENTVQSMLKRAEANKCEVPRNVEAKLHQVLADSMLYEFRRQMKYKSDWYGRDLNEAPKDAPTTQVCHVCGYKNPDLAGIQGLSIVEYDCPHCGTHHNREENSAINLYNWNHGAFEVLDEDGNLVLWQSKETDEEQVA